MYNCMLMLRFNWFLKKILYVLMIDTHDTTFIFLRGRIRLARKIAVLCGPVRLRNRNHSFNIQGNKLEGIQSGKHTL